MERNTEQVQQLITYLLQKPAIHIEHLHALKVISAEMVEVHQYSNGGNGRGQPPEKNVGRISTGTLSWQAG